MHTPSLNTHYLPVLRFSTTYNSPAPRLQPSSSTISPLALNVSSASFASTSRTKSPAKASARSSKPREVILRRRTATTFFNLEVPRPSRMVKDKMRQCSRRPQDWIVDAEDALRWFYLHANDIVVGIWPNAPQAELTALRSASYMNTPHITRLADTIDIPRVFNKRTLDFGLFYMYIYQQERRQMVSAQDTWIRRLLEPLRAVVRVRKQDVKIPEITEAQRITLRVLERCAMQSMAQKPTTSNPQPLTIFSVL
ncbi:hypothetical protein MKEN_01366600 [Mycena kentingensis (nom. inval.)]|nr:hypothetical protein MKEN_01366600 [Mycena kentingensis (nom. inval.)]